MTPRVTIAMWSLFSFLGPLEFAVGKLLCDTALPHWTSDCLDFRWAKKHYNKNRTRSWYCTSNLLRFPCQCLLLIGITSICRILLLFYISKVSKVETLHFFLSSFLVILCKFLNQLSQIIARGSQPTRRLSLSYFVPCAHFTFYHLCDFVVLFLSVHVI